MDSQPPATIMYVGIDIAKEYLDVAIGVEAVPERIAYTAEALKTLVHLG